MEIIIKQNLLEANNMKAAEIRCQLSQHRIQMLNLIGSPGAGKTSLLESILPIVTSEKKVAVIEGDLETARDAERLDPYNVPVALINTHGACHLESVSIEKSLESFDLENVDLVFVENVGNLVCPAEFDVGEAYKIAVLSVPEGDDKPMKYPLLFREASVLVLNKIDLMPYVNFDLDSFYEEVRMLNPSLKIFELSCETGEGIPEFCQWLLDPEATEYEKEYVCVEDWET